MQDYELWAGGDAIKRRQAPPIATVLRKPFYPQDLVNTVKQVLEFSSNGH